MINLKRHITVLLLSLCLLSEAVSSYAQERKLFSDSGFVLASGLSGGDNLGIGDLNNDGNADVVYGWRNRAICYLSENMGRGNFKAPKRVPYGAENLNVGAIGFSDISGNGNLDIVFANPGDNTIDWYENLGNDSFSSRHIISSKVNNAIGLFIADIDGDFDDDIVTTAPWDKEIIWFENLGNTLFSEKKVISNVADRSESIFCSDLDNDGDLDIISPSWGDGKIIWYENYSNGEFGTTNVVTHDILYANAVCAADLDGDGYSDIISGGESNVFWHKNLGNKTFSSKIKLTNNDVTGFNASGGFNIVSVDLDEDGDFDIIISSAFYNKVVWLENNGDATFKQEHLVADSIYPYHSTVASKVTASDLDNDGDLDILIAIGNDKRIVWYENHLNDPSVQGVVYFDQNVNGMLDANERGLGGALVNIEPKSIGQYSGKKGDYTYFLEQGNYKIMLDTNSTKHWKLSSDSSSYNFKVVDSAYALNYNFGLVPSDTIFDVEVFTQSGFPRCNTSVLFTSNIRNLGTRISSGMVWIKTDRFTEFEDFINEPDSLVGDSLAGWKISGLFPRENFELKYFLKMPAIDSVFSIGDKVLVQSSFISYENDTTNHRLGLLVRCSFDPNDKLVETNERNGINYILDGDKLLYTIRFQNSGNDTAFKIVIMDTLDNKLDLSTLEIVNSSHSDRLTVEVKNNRVLIFNFKDINLPDSGTNYFASQGFVSFRISCLPSIQNGDTLNNTGYIYFDSNPAIMTNNVVVAFWDSLPILSVDKVNSLFGIKVYPNPASSVINIELEEYSLSDKIFIINNLGIELIKQKVSGKYSEIPTKSLPNGFYYIIIQDKDDLTLGSYKLIINN